MGKKKTIPAATAEANKPAPAPAAATSPAIEPAKTGETSLDELAEAKAENERLKKELALTISGAEGIIKDLKSQLAETEVKAESGNATPEVTHNKEIYAIAIPKFKHNGVEVTAQELKDNPGLIAELIKIGSGVLVKKQED